MKTVCLSEHNEEALELFVVLSRAYNWVNAHSTRSIRKHELNPTEFGVLELLYHKGPQALQQIGEKILISSGNITYVVDKLEKKKLLCRNPSFQDRRIIYAELTEDGTRFVESIFPMHAEAITRAVDGLNAEERQQTIKLLKRLGHAAQENF